MSPWSVDGLLLVGEAIYTEVTKQVMSIFSNLIMCPQFIAINRSLFTLRSTDNFTAWHNKIDRTSHC